MILTSKERAFLVKALNNMKRTRHGDKPLGIANQMHIDVILYKLKGAK